MTKKSTNGTATDIAAQVDAVHALLHEVGDVADQDVPQYVDSTDTDIVTDEAIAAAKKLGLITTGEVSGTPTIMLTQEGKTLLAQLSKANKKSVPNAKKIKTTTQEDVMSKNTKSEKKSKPKNDLPTYGLPFKRRSTPSIRWVITDALMALKKPVTAEEVAAKIADDLPKGGDKAKSLVVALATWLEKNNAKGFVGLAKSERKAKATKPAKAKADKPKAKKAPKVKAAAAAADADDVLE